MPDSLVEDNVAMIEQGAQLVASLPAEMFTARSETTLNASIGGHLRHNIDHYQCFLRNAKTGRVDYDARDRSPEIESNPEAAAAALRDAADRLRNLSGETLDAELSVRMDTGEGDERPWTHSTVRRELQFLLSHTVHHYALIAMICRINGTQVADNFGVAPSTLKFRRRTG